MSAGFVFGLAQLFRLRFEAGDIYPAYSSLRADPLGCKALYLALGQLGWAQRSFRPLDKLGEGRGTTLFYLGADPLWLEFTPAEYRHLETFMHTGGRLVVGLHPWYQAWSSNWPGATVRATTPPQPQGNAPGAEAHLRPVHVTERWGLAFNSAALRKTDSGRYEPEPAERKVQAPLPDSIPCHTALFFDKLGPGWRVIYARPGVRAVLIERPFGKGSLVVCADSYLFSNQALRQDRHASLLAWLAGASRRFVFDETHLGVSEQPGLPALVRRYRLHGVGVVLAVLAALVLWKNAAPFLPPDKPVARGLPQDTVPGRDMASGFLNLLRRTVPTEELLSTCLVEWKKSCAQQVPRAKLQQVQAIIDAENAKPPRQRDPVHTYAAIAAVLARRAAPAHGSGVPATPAHPGGAWLRPGSRSDSEPSKPPLSDSQPCKRLV